MNYKGFSDYPTYLGAILSVIIRVLLLTFVLIRTIQIVDMSSPDIVFYIRTLYESEVEELGDINLDAYKMDIGVYFTKRNTNYEFMEIPEEIGSVVAKI